MVGDEIPKNFTNITAALTTPPSQIHNGSRSRSPRGYALCVSAAARELRATRLLTTCSFSRDFKKKGMIPLSTYLKQYKVGDIVDVVANGTDPGTLS